MYANIEAKNAAERIRLRTPALAVIVALIAIVTNLFTGGRAAAATTAQSAGTTYRVEAGLGVVVVLLTGFLLLLVLTYGDRLIARYRR